MAKVTVCMIAHNEEAVVEKALESVAWADEIVFLDCESTDGTVGIAERFGARIISCRNEPHVEVNKNVVFSHATHDWILSVDADEVVTEELAGEIRATLEREPVECGFWMPRRNLMLGRWLEHGGHYPDRQLRLFRRGKGEYSQPRLAHVGLSVDGPVGCLAGDIIHLNNRRLSNLITRMDRDSTVAAEVLSETGVRWSFRTGLRHMLLKPALSFCRNYIWRLGFLDGMVGLIYEVASCWNYFIVGAKFWEMSKVAPATLFLDRDGVICVNRDDYVKSWEEFRFLPRALEALTLAARLGLHVIIVTNQSAIARGLVSRETVDGINERMVGEIEAAEGRVDGVYVCPHHPDDGCDCRKPKAGLIEQAASEHDIDLGASYVIGDSRRDLEAASRAGCHGILVLSGLTEPGQEADLGAPADYVAKDLLEAIEWVAGQDARQP